RAGADRGGAAGGGAAAGVVAGERAGAGGRGAVVVGDGTADPGAAGGASRPGRPPDGPVVDERAVADGGRGRRAAVERDRGDGPADPGAAGAARVAGRAGGPVAGEGRVEDGEGPRVVDAAAEGGHAGAQAREADDHVVGTDGVGQGEGAVVPDAAAPQQAVAAGDGQPVHHHRRPGGDPEDPAEVAAADGQPVRARAGDQHVVGDAQLAARQGDRAPQPACEIDDIGARVGVGGRGRRPQRPGPGVGQVPDREGARNGTILQGFDAQPGGRGAFPDPGGG